ncbi:MAG: hypothetical protein RI580_18975 [Halothece sp. Uz-M2-17]|nr:hypothetical protein [Halothece sp. Uz-M2-17]
MAKRRNQKKEKAARNLAYARQFRKKSSGNFQRGRRFSGGNNSSNSSNKEGDSNSNGAAD